MRIIYITRTYETNGKSNNCSGYRNYTVDLLKKKYPVLVVTLGTKSNSITDNEGVITIPFIQKRTDSWFERLGIYEDYLKRWVDDSEKYLKDIIKPDDILLAVSGGELGSIMLGVRLKKKIGCRFIINFHDPVDATTVLGKKSTSKFHVNRDKTLGKLLKFADEIITCTNTYKDVLEEKYSKLFREIENSTTSKIHNVYLGFRGGIENSVFNENLHSPIHLVYAGTMSPTQGAERFVDLLSGLDNIEIIYIGNANQTIKNIAQTNKNVRIVAPMPHDEYMKFIKNEADIGLVALNGIEFGACVPSKIYELINLEIPVFAILPEGDAMDMINNKGYGYSCSGKNKSEVQSLFKKMIEPSSLANIKTNMRKDKSAWQMDKLFEDFYKIIDGINEEK